MTDVLVLSNGMRVILRENRAAPVVAIQMWVDVGSADEPAERAGLAHVLEHMVFKGTRDRGLGGMAREIEEIGGDINAWTSFDHTVYHVVVPSQYLASALDVLVDGVRGPSLDASDLKTELKVIQEEINEVEDAPASIVAQRLFSTAYKQHPYGRPVIGFSRTVGALTAADVRRFHRTHYRPGNMTLVVVGDVKRATALSRIEAVVGASVKGRLPSDSILRKAREERAKEPTQRRLRVGVDCGQSEEAYVSVGFHIPRLTDPDTPSLDLAAVILGQGESSRLVRVLKDDLYVVTDVSSYAYAPLDPGLLVVSATTRPERVVEAVEAIVKEVLKLSLHAPTGEELARARALLLSDTVYQRETMQGQARGMGFYQLVAGDPNFDAEYRRRALAVTTADVRAVAKRYLIPDKMSLAVVTPQVDRRLAKQLKDAVRRAHAKALGKHVRPHLAAQGAKKIERIVLDNGARLLILPDDSVPLVAMRAAWWGGLRYESSANNGINNVLAALTTRGTVRRRAEEISGEMESLAGSIAGFSGRNSFGIRLEVVADHAQGAFDILADCVLNPAFRDEEVEGRRREAIDDIKAQRDNPAAVAIDLLAATAYRGHPYRFNPLGTVESVAALSRRQLVQYYGRHFSPDKMVLAVVGDVEPERVRERFAGQFGSFSAPTHGRVPSLTDDPWRKKSAIAVETTEQQQAHVVLGFPGARVSSSDRYALELVAALLSGQAGRLFTDLREKLGLAYRVNAFSQEGIEGGFFGAYTATSPVNVDVAITAILAQFQHLRRNVVPDDELRRVQRYLIGAHQVAMQRKANLASWIVFDELYELGYLTHRKYADKLRAVTPQTLRRVVRKYLDPQRLVVAKVQPSPHKRTTRT